MQASAQVNKKKRSYADTDLGDDEILYGIVSTGVDWVIIKMVSDRTGVGEVFLSSQSPSQLTIGGKKLNSNLLQEQLDVLFAQIMWIFDEQMASQNAQKRLRTA